MRNLSKKSDLHENLRREEKFKSASDRNFGFVFAVVFFVVGVWSWSRNGQHWIWWLCGSGLFGLLAVFIPRVLGPLNWLWTKLGLFLFRIVSPMTLAILFYVCIAPIGIFLRFVKKDLLSLKWDPNKETYWILRQPPGPDAESLKNQY